MTVSRISWGSAYFLMDNNINIMFKLYRIVSVRSFFNLDDQDLMMRSDWSQRIASRLSYMGSFKSSFQSVYSESKRLYVSVSWLMYYNHKYHLSTLETDSFLSSLVAFFFVFFDLYYVFHRNTRTGKLCVAAM